MSYVALLDALERDVRVGQLAAHVGAAVNGVDLEFEPFTVVKARFDEWLWSPDKTEPVDERLVLLGLR